MEGKGSENSSGEQHTIAGQGVGKGVGDGSRQAGRINGSSNLLELQRVTVTDPVGSCLNPGREQQQDQSQQRGGQSMHGTIW